MAKQDEKLNGWDTDQSRMVIAGDFLLSKYRKLFDNGKVKGSPYEALVFGKVFRMSQSTYGYCSLSKEKIAYELGTSYDSVLRAFKNLIEDGYIVEVYRSKEDTRNTDTKCYQPNMEKMYEDNQKWLKDGIGFSNDPLRKVRPQKNIKQRDNPEPEEFSDEEITYSEGWQ